MANVLNVISVVFTVYQDMDIHRYGLVKQIRGLISRSPGKTKS